VTISSRTPEGQPNHCTVCGFDLRILPSDPAGDAPCPKCGHLLWFDPAELGDDEVVKPKEEFLRAESLKGLMDCVDLRIGIRLVFDLGEVRRIESECLGKLINLKKQLAGLEGQFALRHVHPDVLEILRVTRLDQVFEFEP
jgi:anti-anti-sigma factor